MWCDFNIHFQPIFLNFLLAHTIAFVVKSTYIFQMDFQKSNALVNNLDERHENQFKFFFPNKLSFLQRSKHNLRWIREEKSQAKPLVGSCAGGGLDSRGGFNKLRL
jgi:hypothetical protein